MVFDNVGNLFIGDFANNRIRKVNNVGIILPLSLKKFTAQLQNSSGLLQWQTTNELSTNNFIIEKSLDGRSFSTLDSVIAKNTVGNISYKYLDNHLQNGINYYRLKMVDKDGKFIYSDVATIKVKVESSAVNLFPMPTHNLLNLSFTSAIAGKYTIRITDIAGKVFEQINGQAINGNNKVSINLHQYLAGTYLLNINVAEILISQSKFIKE